MAQGKRMRWSKGHGEPSGLRQPSPRVLDRSQGVHSPCDQGRSVHQHLAHSRCLIEVEGMDSFCVVHLLGWTVAEHPLPTCLHPSPILQAHHRTSKNKAWAECQGSSFMEMPGGPSGLSGWSPALLLPTSPPQVPSASPGSPVMVLSYFCSLLVQVKSKLLIINKSWIRCCILNSLHPKSLPSQARNIVRTQ